MANFYDISSLHSKIVSDIKSAIEVEAYKACETALIKYINKTVYAGGTVEYERTFELLRAVKVTPLIISGSQAEFSLIIDASMMGIDIREGWNAHADFNGTDVRDSIALWLEEGTTNKYHSHEAHGFFQKTYADLETNLIKVMVGALRSRGWDASVI